MRLLPFSEVERMGSQHPQEHIPPKPTDLATIMYTSGTTVRPPVYPEPLDDTVPFLLTVHLFQNCTHPVALYPSLQTVHIP